MDKYENCKFKYIDFINTVDAAVKALNDVLDAIKSIYPGSGESKVDKWRRKHKKCKWCIYHKRIEPPFMFCPSYSKCIAKDKIINENIPRSFCSLFALKKED